VTATWNVSSEIGWAVLLEILDAISMRLGSWLGRDTDQVIWIVESCRVRVVLVSGRAEVKVHSSSPAVEVLVVVVVVAGGAEEEVRLPRSVVGWGFGWLGAGAGGGVGWVDCWNWKGDVVLDVCEFSDANGSVFGAGGCCCVVGCCGEKVEVRGAGDDAGGVLRFSPPKVPDAGPAAIGC